MGNEDLSRRIEDIESKIEELEDLELTNKIEVLELKAFIKNIQAGAVSAPGALVQSPGPMPMPKDIIRAIENLAKVQNGIQRRMDALIADVDEMKKAQRKSIVPQIFQKKEAPQPRSQPTPGPYPTFIPPTVPAPVVGELKITDIRSRIEQAKRIMEEE